MFFSAGGAACAGTPRIVSSGPTTTPSWIAVGTADTTGTASAAPAYGTNAAGDAFVMIIAGRITSVTTPSGWTLITGGTDQGGRKVYAYVRDTRSSGSESGTVSVTLTANAQIATIHTFRNVATSAFTEYTVEGGRNGNGSTVSGLTVGDVAIAAHRLAVIAFGNGDTSGYGSLTGESGGDWIQRDTNTTTTGSDAGYSLQTATLDSGGAAISGGSNTPSVVAPDSYASLAFALVGT